jgi:hypothetical protein
MKASGVSETSEALMEKALMDEEIPADRGG